MLDAAELERHRTGLTGFCYRMLGGAQEAEDVVQETLLRAWRAADSYDPSRGAVATWLYRIATNLCLDLARSAGGGRWDVMFESYRADPEAEPDPRRWVTELVHLTG